MLILLLNLLKIIAWIILIILAVILFFLLLVFAAPLSYNAAVAKRETTCVDVKARWFYGILGVKYSYENNAAENQFFLFNIKIRHAKRREKPEADHRPDEKERPVKDEPEIKKARNIKKPEQPGPKSGMLSEIINYPDKKELLAQTVLLLKHLFKKIKPKYFKLSGEVGFESPHHTGYLLAALGVVRGLKGINIEITPNMEDAVFDFDIRARGYVTLLGLCLPFAAYALSRPVRHAIVTYIKNK